jgi:acyl dehydratase
MTTIPLEAFVGRTGTELGVSRWIAVDQMRIDAFADVTLDRNFIHTDSEAAAQTPFGGTIAHGFLSLSLLSAMYEDAVPPIDGARMLMNYGFNRLRFLSPVPSGRQVRGRFVLQSAEQRGDRLLLTLDVSVEIEGQDKPALRAEWLALAFF